MLKYCQHRGVSDEGKVSCRKIAKGDQEVSLAICEACPAAACNCGHLRFSLEKEGESRLLIRYGNGRTEVLDGGTAGVRFTKSACAAQMRSDRHAYRLCGLPVAQRGLRARLDPGSTDRRAAAARQGNPVPRRCRRKAPAAQGCCCRVRWDGWTPCAIYSTTKRTRSREC